MKTKVFALLAMATLLAVPVMAQQSDPYQDDKLAAQQDQQTNQQPPASQTEVDPQAASAERNRAVEQGEELPRTASPLALLALIGLGGAGAATGLRRIRRR